MMKFAAALSAFALVGVEAKNYSSYSIKRANETRVKLERAFGPGLHELYDEHGKFEAHKLTWAFKKKTVAKPILQQIAVQVVPGAAAIDATLNSAFWLGFTNGFTYKGLENDATNPVLPEASVDLTNCFAASWALQDDFNTIRHNVATFTESPGTAKWFDVVLMDPGHITLDYSVLYE